MVSRKSFSAMGEEKSCMAPISIAICIEQKARIKSILRGSGIGFVPAGGHASRFALD
jgi:hypothetical protein